MQVQWLICRSVFQNLSYTLWHTWFSRCFKSLIWQPNQDAKWSSTDLWLEVGLVTWIPSINPMNLVRSIWTLWTKMIQRFCWDDKFIASQIHIFQGGRSTTNKLNVSIYTSTMDPMGEFNMFTGLTAMSNGGKWHNEEPQFSRGHRSVAQLLYYIMKPSNVGFSTSDKKIPMLFKLFKLPFN